MSKDNLLSNLEFEGRKLDYILKEDGKPLFELYNVGIMLGYSRENSVGIEYPRKDRIDKVVEKAEIEPCVHSGHKYLTEEMLYDFMLEAHTKPCKKFKKWLSNEVLPSIRKHGAYITDELLQDNDRLNDVIAELQIENRLKESKIKEFEEVRTKYMKQRDKIIRIQIKCGNTKENGRFIPYCILQLVREFIKDAENVEYRDDEIIKVDSRKLIRFVKGLFPKNHDAQSYLSQCLDIKVWEDVSVIPTNILEDEYEPLQDILY